MADSPEKETKESPPLEDDSKVDGEAKADLSAVNPLAELSEPRKKTKGRKKSKTGDEEEGSGDKAKDSKPRSASLKELFSYATAFDCFLMIVGFLAALVMGAGLPASMYVFGEAITTFINYEITAAVPFYLGNETLFLAYNSTPGVNATTVTFYTANVADNDVLNCSVTQPLFNAYSELDTVCRDNAAFYDVVSNNSDEIFNIVLTVTETNCSLLAGVITDLFGSAYTCLDVSAFIAEINMWVIYFVIGASGMLVFGYIQISTYQIASERQVFKMRLAYYCAVLRQDIGWFDVNPSGEVCSRLADDLSKVQAGLADKLALLFQWVSTFFFGFAVAFAIEWRLTLLLLGMAPFLVVITGITTKLHATFTSSEQKKYASAGAIAEEVLSSVRTVVAFGGEHNEVERYKSHLGSAARVGIKKGVTLGGSLGLLFFTLFVTYAVAFWFGGWLVSAQLVDGGKILSAFFAVLVGAFALGQAAPSSEALSTAMGSAGAIFDAIKRQPPIDSSSDEGVVPTEEVASVQMKKVNFSYPARPDIQVLKEFSLQVDVGQTVALVGHSGCGKSTVVQLLQRFYDIDSGEIFIGKYPVKELNLKYLRSIIGVVSQEPVLFDTTVAENIRFGRQDATMEEIEAAAKDANVHDFITGLPNGYDTLVGERGTQLSGGQKQRVAIARALLRQPKILLLDEATSALDSESESLVQAALEKASHGRTTIVIAHRLSTIQNADCIVCVDDGEVVEVGTHSELMKKEKLYFDMVTSQSHENADEAFMILKKENLALEEGQSQEMGEKFAVPAMLKSPSRQFSKQYSRQYSGESGGAVQVATKTKTDKQKQAEWDKELKEVPLVKLVALNAPEWWMIVLGILGAIINGAMFPLFAILFGDVLSAFTEEPDMVLSAIHLPAGIFLVLAFSSGIGNFLKMCFFTIAGEKLTARLRARVFKAYLRQEMGWFDQERNSTGSLTTRLAEDAAHVQGATGSHLAILLETFIGLIAALAIAFGYSWIMTLVVLGLVPFVALSTMLRTIIIQSHVKLGKSKMVVAGKLAVDSVENIRTVTSLNLQNTFRQKYKKEVIKPHRSGLLFGVVEGAAYGFSQCVMFFGYAITFRFGAYLVSLDTDHVLYTEFADIFRSLFAVVFGAMAIGQASAFAPNYTKAKLSSKRIFALLNREPEIDNYSEEGQKIESFEGAVEFQNVNFNYPSRPDVPILQDVSLTVKSGQTVALVGPSGCGKSTMVSLLERFYDPKSGDVCVDGSAIPGLNLRWLRTQIGIVSQEPVLFDISIADNIRYGSHHRPVTDEEVIEAAKAANIDEFVQSLPKGYSTNVGDKGTQLSGGQKQRVAIARALIRNPRILLLDEATSALDSESERVVQEALDKARRGRTSIVIAHRLSTIRNADCIVVMTKGKLLEMGTHSELLAKGGLYAQLHNLQQLNKED